MEDRKYLVKVWETEEDRDIGESFIAEFFEDKNEAIAYANKLYLKNDFACVEVEDENDETILHLSSDED